MAVSLEALAMAGEDHLEFKVDIEKWEEKQLWDFFNPPPHLLSPTASKEEEDLASIDCHFVFYFPKTEQSRQKDCDYGDDDVDDDDEVCNLWNERRKRASCSDDLKTTRKKRKGFMAEGLKYFGRVMKNISIKVRKFFTEGLKKKRKPQHSSA